MTGISNDTHNPSTTDATALLQSILEIQQLMLAEMYIMNTYLAAIASGGTVTDDPASLRADTDISNATFPSPVS